MINLEMKNDSVKLIEKLQNYQPYHQAKLISMNILQVKKYCQKQIIEQAKFTYSPFGKPLKNKQKQFKIKEKKPS